MLQWIETTGRTEEEAISAALVQLKLERDDVSVEVLERAKTGFLGFGGNPAKVRVTYEVEEPVQKELSPSAWERHPDQTPLPSDGSERADSGEGVDWVPSQGKEPVQAVRADREDPRAAAIEAFLVGLMERLQVKATPEIYTMETGYQVILQGEQLGAIIGRRGETLDAIQQLTNHCANRGQSKRVRIHMDAQGYRAKREEALRRLAIKMAGKVRKYRKNMTLEPMNAYERHVIHAALQDYPGVSTYSTGVEPNRRTVVVYHPEEK